MTAIEELYDRLAAAVQLKGDDAAIRIHAEYEPQAGPSAKVYPPTYIPKRGEDNPQYHEETRWGEDGEPVDVVVLDSYQSQANRVEAALKANAEELGLPQLVIETTADGRTVRLSSLDAPHRSRDAYFLDSEMDSVAFDKTKIGKALNNATADDATAYLRYAPYDLIYGVWDSHRGRRIAIKFARAFTSEMIGWDVLRGKRSATKGDPLNLTKTTHEYSEWRPDAQTGAKIGKTAETSDIGHGMIPTSPEESTGGVSVRSITRTAVLSLTALARFTFPIDGADASVEGRTVLAALALVGDRLAFGGAGVNLRSGSDLVLTSERIEWVRRANEPAPFELTTADARSLLEFAQTRLASVGVEWASEPVLLQPNERLAGLIEETFAVPEFDTND
jgi:CRISPR-associated protein Csb1